MKDKKESQGFRVLSPFGAFMFFCNKKKYNWYLDRGLADLVSERTIQLNFMPKGPGAVHPHYISQHDNICVVCGGEEQLTAHHVVPYSYRKYMPPSYKRFSSHDVLLICLSDHQKYEKYSRELRLKLAKQYRVPLTGCNNDFYKRKKASGAARTLLNTPKLPEEVRSRLEQTVKDFLQVQEINHKILEQCSRLRKQKKHNPNYVSYSKLVVDQIEDLQEFCVMWRRHFLDTMQPKYMPQFWEEQHNIDHWLTETKGWDISAKVSNDLNELLSKSQLTTEEEIRLKILQSYNQFHQQNHV